MSAIGFERAYYIKLGRGDEWAKESLQTGKVRVGWKNIPLQLIRERQWESVRKLINEEMSGGAATHDFASLKAIVESGPLDVWVTFHDSKLWWCRVQGEIEKDEVSQYRRVEGFWSDKDVNGQALCTDNISGRLLRVMAYRATICSIRYPDDLRRLLNAERSNEYRAVDAALRNLGKEVEGAIKRLHWKDFELLVDLLFRSAGWRRVSVLGKSVKFTDMNLKEPITGDCYQVQVKSEASLSDFERYRNQFDSRLYRRLYFVVHSPDKSLESATGDEKVQLILAGRLANMVMDAGLVRWLMEKVR